MNRFEYHSPRGLDEAFALLEQYGDDAKLLAGGTALVIMMKQELVQPAHLVDLRHLGSELCAIREEADGLEIGALATHRQIESSPVVQKQAPILAETLREVATVRIRNMATIGGNLAHGDPALDPPVALIASDAQVRLRGAGKERLVPLDQMYVDYYETAIQPGEILTDVLVPRAEQGSSAVYLKFLPRTEDDYATVGVGVRLTLDGDGARVKDVRIAIGAAGSTVIRAREAEDVVRGQSVSEELFREAGARARAEVDPLSDIRGSAEYKRDMTEVLVRRALSQALERQGMANGRAR